EHEGRNRLRLDVTPDRPVILRLPDAVLYRTGPPRQNRREALPDEWALIGHLGGEIPDHAARTIFRLATDIVELAEIGLQSHHRRHAVVFEHLQRIECALPIALECFGAEGILAFEVIVE